MIKTPLTAHRPNDKINGWSENEHTRQAARIANMAASVSLSTGDQLSGLLLNVVFVSHGTTERFTLHTATQQHELADKLWELLPDEVEHRTGKISGEVIEEILRLWYSRIYNGRGVQP